VGGGGSGGTGLVEIAVYVAPPSGGPSCRLPIVASSPVTEEVAGRGTDPGPGTGRLLEGSNESPKLASSLALHSPAS
jgi:hypothetical protein